MASSGANTEKKRERTTKVHADRAVMGLDWGGGGRDPLACEVGLMSGLAWVNVDEFYAKTVDSPTLLRHLFGLCEHYNIKRIWCGHEQPRAVDWLNEHGLPAYINQVKGPGSVEHGLRVLYGLIKTGRFSINKERCPNLFQEFLTYRWKVDRHGEIGRKPEDSHNHGIDAVRYYLVGEGEIPLDQTIVPLHEQATIFPGPDGRLHDNQAATIARRMKQSQDQEGELWWDERLEEMDAEEHVMRVRRYLGMPVREIKPW